MKKVMKDIQYTEKSNELHIDLPFSPERIKIEKVKKLVHNIHEKTEYIIHTINYYKHYIID